MRTLETLKRFKPSRAQLIGGSLILSAGMLALAAVPNTFTSGTPISSTAVNANFTDADTRITTLETTVTGGNVVLAPSTAASGNIMKGANRFLHNFGPGNTFLGENAGNFTMDVFNGNNTAIGYQALTSNTSGYRNTASGWNALNNNTTGYFNTANGWQALTSNTTGTSNTAIGSHAMQNATGSNNIALGTGAGATLGSGNNNIAIGNLGQGADSGAIRIGTDGTHLRAFFAGIRGVSTATAAIPVLIGTDGQLGTTSSSRRVKDDIADMGEASSTLMKLRPVTFHYKTDKNPQGRSLQYGLIAEEVEKAAPGLVARSANGEIETVFYQHLTPMLLNEYQKQQRVIDTQTALLKKQTDRVAALEMQAQEIVALKQELARMAAVLARLGQTEKVASVNR